MRTPKPVSPATEADTYAADLVLGLGDLPADHPDRPALRARAIEAWHPMAKRLALRYAGRGEPFDDLLQSATVGLIKAIDRFDPGLGTDFAPYAIPTVLGEIKRYFRDRTWAIRIPRRLQEMRLAINRAQAELNQTLNRSPTIADIAAHLEVSEEAVLEGLEGGRAYRAVSLSTPVGDTPGFELCDLLGSDDHGYELTELRLAMPAAMACLTEREQRIIALRFYGNQTQEHIATQFGVSQMHVSRILAGALRKLRKHLDPDWTPAGRE
ncbi:SigB/SigF/SigG family RNA polymerase sigma factor [Actinoplanes sp. NPDC026619]|uniref:SigB/SigF/SigG family RNA polymerase sigma factor n=1 Tax=Actinoplanes sp. NPDC026619 TaxID=3155798 RepID=UPI0033EA1735